MARSKALASRHEGGRLISQVHQLGQRAFSRVLKRHGLGELNPAQGRIIYALWGSESLSQTELARRTKLDKSTLTLMLRRLEESGLVERAADPRDRRATLISATERNRALSVAYEAASREMTDAFYMGFAAPEIEAFEGCLRRIIANLEGGEG
jgi:MarR family transcriptional regulator, organic hydroperoxide resistance regulator